MLLPRKPLTLIGEVGPVLAAGETGRGFSMPVVLGLRWLGVNLPRRGDGEREGDGAVSKPGAGDHARGCSGGGFQQEDGNFPIRTATQQHP